MIKAVRYCGDQTRVGNGTISLGNGAYSKDTIYACETTGIAGNPNGLVFYY